MNLSFWKISVSEHVRWFSFRLHVMVWAVTMTKWWKNVIWQHIVLYSYEYIEKLYQLMLNSSMNLTWKITVFLNIFFCLFLCMAHTSLCLIWDNGILYNDEKVHLTTIKASQIWIMCIWRHQQIVLSVAWILHSGKLLYFWTCLSLFLYLHYFFCLHAMVWCATVVNMVRKIVW